MIRHSSYVQALLDELSESHPGFSFGLREIGDEFYILLPRSFDEIPLLERILLSQDISHVMNKLRNAGIKAYVDVTDVL